MREHTTNCIEVHVGGISFWNGRVLLLQRAPDRKRYPLAWEAGGGRVEPGENFEEAVKRELLEEAGVIVEIVGIASVYELAAPDLSQKKIPGVKFACKIISFKEGNEPKISSEHIAWKWQRVEELNREELIPGYEDEIKTAYQIYRQKI